MGIDDETATGNLTESQSFSDKPFELPTTTESNKAVQIISDYEAQNLARQDRIRRLFTRPAANETSPVPTLTEFYENYRTYSRDRSITGAEKLIQQDQLILQAELLNRQYNLKKRAVEGALNSKTASLNQTEERLRTLKSRPIYRVTKFFEIQKLEQQRRQQQLDSVLISSQASSNESQRGSIIQSRDNLSAERQSEIARELRHEVQESLQGYEQLDQLISDPKLIAQLQDNYIKEFIIAEADQYLLPDIVAEEKEKIITRLETALKAVLVKNGTLPIEKEKELQEYNEALIPFFGSSKLGNQAEWLMTEGVEKTLKVLTTQIVAKKTEELLSLIPSDFEDNTLTNEAIAEIENFKLNRGLQTRVETIFAPDQNIGVKTWTVVKSSPLFMDNFPQTIKDCDDECCQIALRNALQADSATSIDTLEFFPSPEAIRLLILIQAADSGYYNKAAAEVYRHLAKKPDWGKIVSETAAVYPEVKSIANTLKPRGDDTRQIVTSLALATIEQNPDDKKLCKLARSTLPTEKLINLTLTSEQASVVNTAIGIINQKDEEHHTSLDISLRIRHILTKVADNKETDKVYSDKIINRLTRYSQTIINNQSNLSVLTYVSLDKVINVIVQDNRTEEDVDAILTAATVCPQLATDFNLSEIFFQKYRGPDTPQFFRDMVAAYQKYPKMRDRIFDLESKNGIDRQRAIELPQKVGEMLVDPFFYVALESPQLFLNTDEGLRLFRDLSNKGLFSLSIEQEKQMGQNLNQMRQKTTEANKLTSFITDFGIIEQRIAQNLLTENTSVDINDTNWTALLTAYVRKHSPQPQAWGITEPASSRLEDLFNQTQTKNEILQYFRKAWQTYLLDNQDGQNSFSLPFLTEIIHSCGGVAVLSQLDAISEFARNTDIVLNRPTIENATRTSILNNLDKIESRFNKEHWSEEDRRQFYNVSRDIVSADANLFNEFLNIFNKLSEKDLKKFVKDIYPLHRTQLVLLEKRSNEGTRQFTPDDLNQIISNIRQYAENPKENFTSHKQKLASELNRIFKDRFGIINLPDEMTDDDNRSINDASQYLASLHLRDNEKETILGFYLALNLNKKWRAFREGQEIKPAEFLTTEKAAIIENYLNQRKTHNVLTAENLGLSQDQLPKFLEILENETQNFSIGSIETVDVKLNNIILNLHRLEDPDLYQDPLDQDRFQLVKKWGDKTVSSVVAKMYQQLNRPDKITFTTEEEQIRQTIVTSLSRSEIPLTTKALKDHFQDGLRPFTLVANLINTAVNNHAEAEIDELRKLTKPSPEIIQLFNQLGEQFSPTSGALALSHDLNYLDTLVVKRESELNADKKALVVDYVSQIRQQLNKLEQIFQEMKTKVQGIKPETLKASPQLIARLTEISQIAANNQDLQTINSGMSSDLNMIIENMRECLSCTLDGSNNDTNLTFGDSNKFYLYSQRESLQGTVADEILFFVPISTKTETTMSFVMDRLYGTNTPFILENHIQVVLKKAQSLKQHFPQSKISVFIPATTFSSSGSLVDTVIAQLAEKSYKAIKTSVEINVPPSAGGDHYVEFGGSARISGKRQSEGVLISI